MRAYTNPGRLTSNKKNNPAALRRDEIRAASLHCAQAKLFLLRLAVETLDPWARDLAAVCDYLIVEITQLATVIEGVRR